MDFRPEFSEVKGETIVLAFDASSPTAFEGMAVNQLVMEKAASYGFGNSGNSFMPDIVAIDAETDRPMEPDPKTGLTGKVLKCHRAYFTLRRRV